MNNLQDNFLRLAGAQKLDMSVRTSRVDVYR